MLRQNFCTNSYISEKVLQKLAPCVVVLSPLENFVRTENLIKITITAQSELFDIKRDFKCSMFPKTYLIK